MKLAVGITYHNEKELLTQCLESLRGQQVDEIWVYDDASHYPAKDYISNQLDVRILRGETGLGPSRGRNRLLQIVQSEYVHFHDADDLFRPRWAQGVRQALEHAPDLVFTEMDSTRHDRPYGQSFVGLRQLQTDPDLVRFALRHPIQPSAATYRTAFLKMAGGYREDLWQSEDYELHVRLAAGGARYATVLEPLVCVRVRDESRSQKQLEVWECRLQSLNFLRLPLQDSYSAELSEAYASTGGVLWRLGARGLAKRAFELSAGLGAARYEGRPWSYRLMAWLFGPRVAEQSGEIYRGLIPRSIRGYLR